ncbi:MAG: phosphatidylinositol-3,5-bisphosphate 5-phosphatase [Phylliscum demangeonii]|nr:MAG: phosphatidylinositol-3,5-bisphosphate 5-phosphatase [Phylliscum demangeonii]
MPLNLYHDHGDTLAIQYGGSHLVNTMETYRKINQWSSHSRDMVESFKRYYHNSFLDSQRQEAYNLFLGNYIFAQDQPMLWDLSTDYYLHHSNPRSWLKRQRRSYFEWFTPAHLQEKHMPAAAIAAGPSATNATALSDDYWVEYYRPLAISSLQKLFSFRMNSTSKLVATKQAQDDHLDPSPFSVRVTGDLAAPRKRRVKKTVVPLEHGGDEISDDASSILSRSTQAHAEKRTPGHFQPTTLLPMDETNEQADEVGRRRTETSDFPSAIDSSTLLLADNRAVFPAAAAAHRTLDDIVQRSLNPTVTQPEADEYERYLQHPRHLPLVSAIAPPSPPAHLVDFLHYLHVGEPGPTTADEDVAEFVDFLTVPDDPLLVTEADAPKKRYKAYRQWLKGRSLFKQQQQQQRVD